MSKLVPDGEADIDRVLIDRVASRDAEALGALYDRHGRLLFGVLRALVPTTDAAEEVVQDAFHSVWRHASSYAPSRGSVRTWLLAIARNAAIDWLRTRGTRLTRERSLDDATAMSDPSADQLLEKVALKARVRDALAGLPPEQREVVVLAFYGGLTQTEIASRTGAPLGTVKSRARLAMGQLRRVLVEEQR